MPTSRRQSRPYAVLAAFGVAVAAHVAIAVPTHGFGLLDLGGDPLPPAKPKILAEEVDLVTSCRGDNFLAAGARFALCGAPWVADVDTCLDEARTQMWMDLSSCEQGPTAEVAMLDPKQMERAEQRAAIDAEKLLEEMPQPLLVSVVPPPPPPPQVAPPPPPPEQPKLRSQVVETVKPQHEQEPTDARFLSEYNTKVEKQTVARGSVKEPMAQKPKPDTAVAVEKPKDEPVATPKPSDEQRPVKPESNKAPDNPGLLSMRNPGAPTPQQEAQDPRTKGAPSSRGPSAIDGVMPKRGDGAFEQEHRERQEIPRGGQSGGGGGAPPDLKPSKEMLERIAGGGSVDHTEDVDHGDETALNSKRFVYAGFFNRVKRQVAQNWSPQGIYRAVDPEGKVYGYKSRETEIRVSLSPAGTIQKIVITNPCGISELDDEGVRAMKVSGPFPNVPEGLVGHDGTVTFLFSFNFNIGDSHTSWRMIKSL